MNAAATPAPALGTDVDAGTPYIPVDAPQDEEPRLIAGELHEELTKHLQDAFKITSLACVPMTRADIDQRGAPAMLWRFRWWGDGSREHVQVRAYLDMLA